MAAGTGPKADPWQLKTPPGTSAYQMWIDEAADPPAIVCQVGGTQLRYDRRAIDDLHAMLKAHGDWMPLGGADEQKPAPDRSVEAWGRSTENPVGGWYGLKKGLRGRFGVWETNAILWKELSTRRVGGRPSGSATSCSPSFS